MGYPAASEKVISDAVCVEAVPPSYLQGAGEKLQQGS